MFHKISVISKFVITLALPALGLVAVAVFAMIDRPLDAFVIAAMAGVAVVASLVIGVVMARSLTGPLRELGSAMTHISEQRLPAVVDQMSTPEVRSVPAPFEPVLPSATREIGVLANAVNSVGAATDRMATHNAELLRKGISEIFVNLARRNQALLDRQIEFIDDLEANEADPDQLKNLYTLDHLATRMRRNADSLLVLAGADTPRKRGQPVQLTDVVRVAVGEIEHYTRVKLALSDTATVSAGVAADLAHLLSELMENAAQFSPPDTPVEVIGRRTPEGDRFVLVVRDHGVGLDPRQLDQYNSRIASPPSIGLAVSRALGFTVVGRLAQRHGLTVQLRSGPDNGVDAAVLLPASLLDPDAVAVPARIVDDPYALPTLHPEPVSPPAEPASVPPAPPPPPPPLSAPRPPVVMTEPPVAPTASARTDTYPDHPPAPTRRPAASAAPTAPSPAGDAVLEGLTRRPPRTTSPADQAEQDADDTAAPSARRSPEQVRAMLSRYRGGLHKGRTDAHGGPSHTDAHGGPSNTDAHGGPSNTDAHGGPSHTDARHHGEDSRDDA